MKLASFTDNSQSFLKYGDTNTFLHVQISEDGTFVDLTQALAVNVPVANDDGLLFTKTIDTTKLANGDSGIVDINFTSDDQNNLPPDDYYLEIWVTNHDGTIGIYPADENQLMFTITDNLTLITGDVVPAVAFDDFQNMFNTLQQQVHNAIANGLKGDKGDKGDTGEGLDIKGRVDSVSELPTTANEGTGYLVNEELYVYTSGAWKDCGPIQGPQGVQGVQGKTGNGISSTAIQYQISNSATTTPTGTWSNSLIATTQVNPFLWTQVTLSYDDGTSKSFYLVSSKGDKGDKGDTGATGPVGPVGPVGAGLVVKGTVNNVSQLPKTGNQEGYCYFVGTDLYVWDAGAWKNCGSVSPDLSKYVTVTDLNNGLSTKADTSAVEQLKTNLTNQVSILQTQVDNSAVGTNLIVQSDLKSGYITRDAGGVFVYSGNDFYSDNYIPTNGATVFTLSSDYVFKGNINDTLAMYDSDKNYLGYQRLTSATQTLSKPNVAYIRLSINFVTEGGTSGNLSDWLDNHRYKLEKGNVATDWCPNPEDKVNVSDMRKPASDVAGIEEVNAKQDKIGYTPADDSKVLHSTVTDLNSTDMNTVKIAGFYRLISGTNGMPNADNHTIYQVIPYGWANGVQLVYGTNNAILGMRSWSSYNNFTNWIQFADDSKVVHTADMRKPANDVVGLEDIMQTALPDGTDFYTLLNTAGRPLQYFASSYAHAQTMINKPTSALSTFILITSSVNNRTTTSYNYTFFNLRDVSTGDSYKALINTDVTGKITVTRPWHKIADDSKVAHLSGANNFDTVPTVNNTPLLTSDKLPDNIVKQGDVIGNIDYVMQNRYSMSDGKLDITTGGVVSDPSSSYKTTGFVYINSLIKNFTIVNSSAISKDALIIAFYDNTMKFISGVSFDGTTVNQKTINVPSNTGIIKFSIVYASADSMSMYAGSNVIDTNNWPSYSGISLGGKQGATIDDVTNAINTATANAVTTNKLANFTAGLQSGGVDVATAADLKSIEDSAWHTITGKNDTLSSYTCLYRKNNEQKYVDLVLSGIMGVYMGTHDPSKEILDLSGIVSAPNGAAGDILAPNVGTSGGVSISGTKILFSWEGTSYSLYQGTRVGSIGPDLNRPFFRVTFN